MHDPETHCLTQQTVAHYFSEKPLDFMDVLLSH